MRKLFALVAFMVWTLQASATDGITIANVSIPQGGEAIATVNLESVTSKYGGFQFDLQLPAGISAAAIAQASRLTAISGFVLQMNSEDNTYTVLGFNTSHTEIAGNDGAVAYITLRAGAGVSQGDELTANIKNAVLSTVTETEVNAANSSFTITIGNPLETVTLSEEDTEIQPAIATDVNVTVNRTINANEWSTICLPFDMSEAQVKAAFGEDVKLEDFTGWSFEGTPDNVTKINVVFSDVNSIAKNHPYLIKVSDKITSFNVYNVRIYKANATNSVVIYDDDDNQYIGSMVGVRKIGTVANNSIFLANNKFYYSTGSTNIKAYRATFNFGNIVLSDPSPSRITMSFDEPSSETTGIKDVKVVRSDKVYNLSGQQVKNPTKGLYIQDGKKVIIK